jgi:hypothetical protein
MIPRRIIGEGNFDSLAVIFGLYMIFKYNKILLP